MTMAQDYTQIFNNRGHEYNAAMSSDPGARTAERTAILNLLDAQAGEIIADTPAGGGYVADGLREKLGDQIEVICIEPAKQFGAAINRYFRVLQEPIDEVSLPAASLDGITSLAGLHHFAEKDCVYREWARLIKPGGRVVVADVEIGTGTAEFLNSFVHEYTPGGHVGTFFEASEFTAGLTNAGFSNVQEQRKSVPWSFADSSAMVRFCRTLFSINAATPEQVEYALNELVGVKCSDQRSCDLQWELRYAQAWR